MFSMFKKSKTSITYYFHIPVHNDITAKQQEDIITNYNDLIFDLLIKNQISIEFNVIPVLDNNEINPQPRITCTKIDDIKENTKNTTIINFIENLVKTNIKYNFLSVRSINDPISNTQQLIEYAKYITDTEIEVILNFLKEFDYKILEDFKKLDPSPIFYDYIQKSSTDRLIKLAALLIDEKIFQNTETIGLANVSEINLKDHLNDFNVLRNKHNIETEKVVNKFLKTYKTLDQEKSENTNLSEKEIKTINTVTQELDLIKLPTILIKLSFSTTNVNKKAEICALYKFYAKNILPHYDFEVEPAWKNNPNCLVEILSKTKEDVEILTLNYNVIFEILKDNIRFTGRQLWVTDHYYDCFGNSKHDESIIINQIELEKEQTLNKNNQTNKLEIIPIELYFTTNDKSNILQNINYFKKLAENLMPEYKFEISEELMFEPLNGDYINIKQLIPNSEEILSYLKKYIQFNGITVWVTNEYYKNQQKQENMNGQFGYKKDEQSQNSMTNPYNKEGIFDVIAYTVKETSDNIMLLNKSLSQIFVKLCEKSYSNKMTTLSYNMVLVKFESFISGVIEENWRLNNRLLTDKIVQGFNTFNYNHSPLININNCNHPATFEERIPKSAIGIYWDFWIQNQNELLEDSGEITDEEKLELAESGDPTFAKDLGESGDICNDPITLDTRIPFDPNKPLSIDNPCYCCGYTNYHQKTPINEDKINAKSSVGYTKPKLQTLQIEEFKTEYEENAIIITSKIAVANHDMVQLFHKFLQESYVVNNIYNRQHFKINRNTES